MKKTRSRPSTNRQLRERYPIHQCALFRIGSKRRLALLLGLDVVDLLALSRSRNNYKIFELKAKEDELFHTIRKSRAAQEPKTNLRRIHERLLRLLQWVEVPDYLHSATKGRSYLSNADRHKEGVRLLKLDIRRFFPSTTESRTYNFFRERLECASDVSRILARLVTYNGALPTGSPLSPLLSFHANRPLLDELHQFAQDRGLAFTCYVDDLTFSGDAVCAGMVAELKNVILAHGHTLSEEKTRFYGKGTARTVTGIVLKGGEKFVPNERMRKARILRRALKLEGDPGRRRHLAERLNGLVGEASTIDARFQPWAKWMRLQLRAIRAEALANAALHVSTTELNANAQQDKDPA